MLAKILEVVKSVPSALVTALIGGPFAIVLTHRLTSARELKMLDEKRYREKQDAEEKRLSELAFISVELIFRLEEFAKRCADVAQDYGEPEEKHGYHIDIHPSPELIVKDIEGDWKSLPSLLLYQVLELPILRQDAVLRIEGETEHMLHPPENRPSKEVRQKYYAELGIRACELAIELRRLSGFPESDLVYGEWSALPVMRKVIRREEDKTRREESDT